MNAALNLIRAPYRSILASRSRETQPIRMAAPDKPRAIMVNGRMQTIGELRSSYTRNTTRWISALGFESQGDYSAPDLAVAYKAETAFIGINVRAGIASELPVHVVDHDQKQIDNSPANLILEDWSSLAWKCVASSLIWGVVYLRKIYNPHGYPTDLEWLSPLDVEPDVDYSNGTIRGYWLTRIGGREYLRPRQMIVDRTFNTVSDVDGTSALEIAMVRSNVSMNIGKFGAAFFGNGARPDGLITFDGAVSDDDRLAFKTYWDSIFKGVKNAFRTAILGTESGGSPKYTQINPNPVDLAMTDLSSQADMKVLAILQVNPVLAGIGQAADPLSAQGTYDAVRIHHVEYIASKDVRQICNVLNTQWLHCDFPGAPTQWTLEPDLTQHRSTALGTADRVTTASASVTGHVWSVNEAREYTGREPINYHVDRNPDWANSMFERGLLDKHQSLAAVGYSPATMAKVPNGLHPTVEEIRVRTLNSRLLSGGMTLNEYRLALKDKPLPNGDVLYIPAASIQVSLDQIGVMQPKPSYQPFGNPQVTPYEAAQLASGIVPPPPPDPNNTVTIEPAPANRSETRMAQLHELSLWQARVRKKGAAARFNSEHLPEHVASWVRSNLADGWPAAQVFDAARSAIRVGGDPKPLGATPEELEAYWRDYDGLQTDIREAWLNEYMKSAGATIRPNMTDGEISAALAQHHDDLINAWIGTLDNPGALLALVLAGAVAGNRTLETGAAARPQRAAGVGLAVSWDIVSKEALSFVRQYAFNLIRQIDDTTVGMVREAINQGIADGLSTEQLTDALMGIFNDTNRARLIAISESNRAYQNGAFQRWQNAGVTRSRWATVNDSHICPTCRRLNGSVAVIGEGWRDPETGAVYRDLAHPGCRCPKKPEL